MNFCLVVMRSFPSTGIGSIQAAISNTIPMIDVDQKCFSGSMQWLDVFGSQ